MNESEYKERERIAAERDRERSCVDGDVTGRESLWRECCSSGRESGKSLCDELAVCLRLLPGLGGREKRRGSCLELPGASQLSPHDVIAWPALAQASKLFRLSPMHNTHNHSNTTTNPLPMPHLISYLSTPHHSFPRLLACRLPPTVSCHTWLAGVCTGAPPLCIDNNSCTSITEVALTWQHPHPRRLFSYARMLCIRNDLLADCPPGLSQLGRQ